MNNNRLVNTLNRLHDSGAVYTLGQMPGTTINGNYVKGIPAATSGPTYGLHNDEGSAYITENDNVLDIDPGVKYTINCEDFGAKHDLTIRTNVRDREQDGREPADQHDRSAGRRRRQRVAGDPVHHLPEFGDPGRVPRDPADRARLDPGLRLPGELRRWRGGRAASASGAAAPRRTRSGSRRPERRPSSRARR